MTETAVEPKRAKKSMTVVNTLVGLQQSTAFNDLATAVDSRSLLATNIERPKAPPSSAASRRRQRNVLIGSQGTFDSRTMRQYGDALCVDMQSKSTLANMRVVDGRLDRRCICGTPRLLHAQQLMVVLMPREPSRASALCNKCGRLSAAYERYCIDSRRVTKALKPPGSAPDASDEVSVSNESVDMYVQTLLLTFNDDLDEPKRAASQPARKSRKRLFADAHENKPIQDSQRAPEGKFVYGNRSVSCRHASLTELDVPLDEARLINEMLKQ